MTPEPTRYTLVTCRHCDGPPIPFADDQWSTWMTAHSQTVDPFTGQKHDIFNVTFHR